MKYKNYMIFKFHYKLPIKFYWNIAMPLCLHVIYSCFCTTKAKLRNCNRDHMTCEAKNIHYLACFYIKKRICCIWP